MAPLPYRADRTRACSGGPTTAPALSNRSWQGLILRCVKKRGDMPQ